MADYTPPDGYHTVSPSLVAEDASGLIDFLTDVFGASERMRMNMLDGSLAHAELQIGDSAVMIGPASEFNPAMGAALYVYVEDVDGTYQRALTAGATSFMEPEDAFYGDRVAAVHDRFGNRWSFATVVEEVTEEELARRMEAFAQQPQG